MEPNITHSVRPAQVAMLCNGDDLYGIATIVKLYAIGMPETLFVCFSDGPLYQHLKAAGSRVLLADGLNRYVPRKSLQTLADLPSIMRRTRQDAARLHENISEEGIRVLHTHWLPQQLIAGHARRHGYTSVWQINNNTSRTRMFGIGRKLNWKLARWGADLLLPASGFIADNWRGCGVPVRVVHNAAEVQPPTEFAPPSPAPPLRCLVAGRMDPSKGHHIAVRAVIAAREAGADVTLDVYGGPLEDNAYALSLQNEAKTAGQEDAIRLKGFCDDLRRRHGTYHLGLQCRVDPEPCSLWVCETLVDGLPLVASATGGTPELVEDGVTGWLCRPGDADRLTEHLVRLAGMPEELKAARSAAARRGAENHTLERFIEKTLNAYTAAGRLTGAGA